MIGTTRQFVVEKASRGVFVVRFVTPDVREYLDSRGDSCPLLDDLRSAILEPLEEGQTLVLNLGLIEPFPSAFYTFLLRVREAVLARNARLVLCRLGPSIQEAIDLFKGNRLFRVVRNEGQAVRESRTESPSMS